MIVKRDLARVVACDWWSSERGEKPSTSFAALNWNEKPHTCRCGVQPQRSSSPPASRCRSRKGGRSGGDGDRQVPFSSTHLSVFHSTQPPRCAAAAVFSETSMYRNPCRARHTTHHTSSSAAQAQAGKDGEWWLLFGPRLDLEARQLTSVNPRHQLSHLLVIY